ncbi:MAG TPA: sigma-70 family RNA polymerase sigma factor [Polyangiaceae bacterium]|nr:sigma-70 family RNA polymerase sigma factor [Polyangiaceae bacterium]
MTSSEPSLRPAAPEAPDSGLDFATVYRENFPFVWRMARRLGVAEHALDDVCQDVFVVIHRRLADFEGRSSLRSWIFGILHNVALVHRRKLRRKSPEMLEREAPLEPDLLGSHDNDPGERAAWSEQARVANAILNEIAEDKRTVLVLVELEGMSTPEVAEALGINVNTASARLRAARKEFAAWVVRHRARERWRSRD